MFTDLPDPDDDGFYQWYVERCRLAGIEPVPHERVGQSVGEWNQLIVTARAPTNKPAH